MPIPDRVRFDDNDGVLDDLWLTGAEVHIERLSKRHFYIGVYKGNRLIQLYAKDVRFVYDSADRGIPATLTEEN